MSDKMERDIDEIMGRLGEPAPGEGARRRMPRLIGGWTAGLRRTVTSRWPHFSRRQTTLASLVLVALVAGGLFVGLVYPSLTSGESGDGQTVGESADDQIGEAAHVDDEWPDGSDDEALGTEGSESREEADHASDDHEEGDGDRGERHH